MAQRLEDLVKVEETITVGLPNGTEIHSQTCCPQFDWSIDNYQFSPTTWVLKLQNWDAILGVNWLQQLGNIHLDYNLLT